jgi:hypothetical protein
MSMAVVPILPTLVGCGRALVVEVEGYASVVKKE